MSNNGETAVFWHKVGWRNHVVSNEEIKCTGCGCRPSCSFMILPYQKEKNISDCHNCNEYCCDKINSMLSSLGRIYTGVCVDACSTLGICAERNAIFNMLTNGEQQICKVIAIMKVKGLIL